MMARSRKTLLRQIGNRSMLKRYGNHVGRKTSFKKVGTHHFWYGYETRCYSLQLAEMDKAELEMNSAKGSFPSGGPGYRRKNKLN